MADEKTYRFVPLGVYNVGVALEKLDWALSTLIAPTQLAPFFESLRVYKQVRWTEDIGTEAGQVADDLIGRTEIELSERDLRSLRDKRSGWDALFQERLGALHLITPTTSLQPQKLMGGVGEFVSDGTKDFLEQGEIADLSEACLCLLGGSATAAELMSLRATESLLRRWYTHKTGKKIGRSGWARTLDRLAKEFPEHSRPKELTLLGYMRLRRNEVAHPDERSTISNAETTFMNSCNLAESLKTVMA